MIRFVLNVYIMVLFVYVVLTYLPRYRHLQWVCIIRKLADFTCGPVRRRLPDNTPFDFSPFIVIIGIKIVQVVW